MRDKISRIMDANLNRAREGLRVVEELARMVLENSTYQIKLKKSRHQLVMIEKKMRSMKIISSRDIVNDPGAKITLNNEKKRTSLQEVGRANIRRCQEAFRVLEEFAKFDSPQLSKTFKALRFDAYELESELIKSLDKRDKKK